MGFDIGSVGQGAASGALGQVLGIVSGGMQDKRQLKQQGKLQELQIRGNKEMADYQQGLQYDMWKRTNYGAQVAEMKDAGLNPAMIYGTGGGSGQTTTGSGAGAGVTGAQASDPTSGARLGMEMGMMTAQKRVLESQAQKNEAEAEKIKGVDTDNTKATTENTTAATKLKNIELEIAGKTKEEAIKIIEETANKALAEAVIAQQKQVINEETMNSQITQIKNEAIGSMIKNQEMRSGIKLNEERIKEIANSIQQRWESIDVDKRGLEVSKENMEKMTEAMLWGAGINAAGNIVKGIVDVATKPKGILTEQVRNSGEGWSTTQTRTSNIR